MNTCNQNKKAPRCCCNCENLKPLHKHPTNRKLGVGAMHEVMGYVCDVSYHLVFFESQHGMCELWSAKIEPVSNP